jgi:hypothetical protein
VKLVGENPADKELYFVIQDSQKSDAKSSVKSSLKIGVLWVKNREIDFQSQLLLLLGWFFIKTKRQS